MELSNKLLSPFTFLKQASLVRVCFLLLVFTPLIFTLFGVDNFTSVKTGVILVSSGWIIIRYYKTLIGVIKIYPTVAAFLGVMVLSAFISIFGSQDYVYGIIGAPRRYTDSISFFVAWSIALLAFIQVFREDNEREIMLKTTYIMSVLIAVYGVYQAYFGGFYQTEVVDYARIPSFLGNANFSSMFIAVSFPLGLWWYERAVSKWAKPMLLVSFIIIVWSFPAFASRGALLALATGLLVYVFAQLRFGILKNWRSLLFTSGVLLVTVIGTLTFLGSVRSDGLSSGDQNISGRLMAWGQASRMVASHPFFGVGVGNFGNAYAMIRPNFLAAQETIFDDAHNIFFHLTAAGGVFLGGAFLLLIIITFTRGIFVYFRNGKKPLLVWLSALVAWSAAACFTPVDPANWLLLALIIAGVWAGIPESVGEYSGSVDRVWVRFPAGLILMLLGCSIALSQPLFGVSKLMYESGRYMAAFRLAQISRIVNPLESSGYLLEAGSLVGLGAPLDRIQSVIKQMEFMHPNDHANAAIINYKIWQGTGKQEYLDEGIEELHAYAEQNPTYTLPYSMLASFSIQGGKVDDARFYATKSLTLAVDKTGVIDDWVILAFLYQQHGNKVGLINALDHVYRLSPFDVRLRAYIQAIKKENDISKVAIPIQYSPRFFF